MAMGRKRYTRLLRLFTYNVNITFQVQRFYWYYYLYTGYGIFEAGLETAYYDSYECYKGRYSPALPNLNPRSKHYLCLLQLVKTQYPGTRQSGTTGGRLCSWNVFRENVREVLQAGGYYPITLDIMIHLGNTFCSQTAGTKSASRDFKRRDCLAPSNHAAKWLTSLPVSSLPELLDPQSSCSRDWVVAYFPVLLGLDAHFD
eukprot:873499-Rhodomonas_salina.2